MRNSSVCLASTSEVTPATAFDLLEDRGFLSDSILVSQPGIVHCSDAVNGIPSGLEMVTLPAGMPFFCGFFFRLIDLDGSSLKATAIQRLDRHIRLRIIGHVHEAKALGLAGDKILYQTDRLDSAKFRKQPGQVIFRGTECQVTYIHSHRVYSFLLAGVSGARPDLTVHVPMDP